MLAQLRERVEVIQTGTVDVDLAAAVAALAERGLTRVLCEGGPHLFSALAAAGVVDELCLSLTPMLVGPGPGRIVEGPPWPQESLGLRLTGLLEEDGALFCRYRHPREEG